MEEYSHPQYLWSVSSKFVENIKKYLVYIMKESNKNAQQTAIGNFETLYKILYQVCEQKKEEDLVEFSKLVEPLSKSELNETFSKAYRADVERLNSQEIFSLAFVVTKLLNTIPPKDELDMNENSLIHEYISSIRDSFEAILKFCEQKIHFTIHNFKDLIVNLSNILMVLDDSIMSDDAIFITSHPLMLLEPTVFADYDDTLVNDTCDLYGKYAFLYESEEFNKEKEKVWQHLVDIYMTNYTPFSNELSKILSTPELQTTAVLDDYLKRFNDYLESEITPIMNSNYHKTERKEIETMIGRLCTFKPCARHLLPLLSRSSPFFVLSQNWCYNSLCGSLKDYNVKPEQIFCNKLVYDDCDRCTGEILPVVRSGREKVQFMKELHHKFISIYIGDSVCDVLPLMHADMGFLYGHSQKVCRILEIYGYKIVSIQLLKHSMKKGKFIYAFDDWSEFASVYFTSELFTEYIQSLQSAILKHFTLYQTNSPASMCRLMALTSDTLNDEEDEEITRLFNAKKSPEEVIDVITKGEADVYRSVEGGATMIQLRDKTNGIARMVRLAKRLLPHLHEKNIPLIINDRVDVAVMSNADGVHIGQSDLSPILTRKLIGPDKILGVSCNTPEQVHEAEKANIDYIGTGAIYPTNSKYDADITGLDGLQAVCESTHIPVVSIGGVNKDNCHESIEHGAIGIAVISAIFGQKDVKKASKDLYDAVMTSLEENHKL